MQVLAARFLPKLSGSIQKQLNTSFIRATQLKTTPLILTQHRTLFRWQLPPRVNPKLKLRERKIDQTRTDDWYIMRKWSYIVDDKTRRRRWRERFKPGTDSVWDNAAFSAVRSTFNFMRTLLYGIFFWLRSESTVSLRTSGETILHYLDMLRAKFLFFWNFKRNMYINPPTLRQRIKASKLHPLNKYVPIILLCIGVHYYRKWFVLPKKQERAEHRLLFHPERMNQYLDLQDRVAEEVSQEWLKDHLWRRTFRPWGRPPPEEDLAPQFRFWWNNPDFDDETLYPHSGSPDMELFHYVPEKEDIMPVLLGEATYDDFYDYVDEANKLIREASEEFYKNTTYHYP